MRPFVLAAVAALALFAWWLAAGPPRPPASAEPPPGRRPERRAGPAPTAPPLPERNVFEYAGRPPVARTPMAQAPRSAPPLPPETLPLPAAAPDPVRLVGLVHRGGRLRAVLSVQGEVAILAPGEEIHGYRVLAVDEERVRLQGPDGTERALARPEGD